MSRGKVRSYKRRERTQRKMFGVGYARSFSTSVKPELLVGVALVLGV